MNALIIGFPSDFESSSKLAIAEQQTLPEHEHIWIWDHYYSLTMNRISDSLVREKLEQTLATWASAIAPKLFNTAEELNRENALVLDHSLQFMESAEDCEEYILVETLPEEGSWPGVNIKLPDDLSEKRLAYSAIALAQYFLSQNQLFFRELPLHVLAMRKFYMEHKPCTDEDSIAEAPAFAFQTAMKFFTDMNAGPQH